MTDSKYIFSKKLNVLSTKHCNCLGIYKATTIENKTNLTFQVRLQKKVLNTGFEKIGFEELIYKVVTSDVFIVAYKNKRNTCKALYTL